MLLLLLLAAPGHRLARDQVMDLLWPDAAPDSALTALYTALHALRRTLQPDLLRGRESTYVEASGGMVGLRWFDGSYVDVDAFRAAMARAESAAAADRHEALREAIALYGGDLLADEPYVDWPVATRERLRRDWRRAVLDLADLERDAGRPLAAVPALEALLATDPTDEAGHRGLMRAFSEAGRRADALAQYERCVRTLRYELDAGPSEDTTALARAIEAAAPAVVVAARRPLQLTELPSAPTPLVGRRADVAAVRDLIASHGARLVTVVGAGGIGKTRLAVEVAHELSQILPAAAFVPLASVTDPGLVVPTIARALHIDETADRTSADQMRDALYERDLLLVLDNFEQVIGAAREIAALLEGNSGLRLLITSREALDLRAERRYPLAPLSVPRPATGGTPQPVPADVVAEHDAVKLFVDRVRAAVPAFRLTDDNASAVAAICARLDGLPLAIELAAVRGRHMTPADLLARLERRLPLLTGGPRDLPQRLRTMHDAIAWSHDLLNGAEQRLFRRLSVFVGGCPMDLAEALVTRLDADAAPAADSRPTTELVASLADKSLLGVADDGRISMFETIREFGQGQLAASGEDYAVRSAHATLFLDVAERAASELTGRDQAAWLNRLASEHDNLRSAFETLRAHEVPDGALRLCRALARFWRMRGHFTEGRSHLELALAREGGSRLVRARALVTAADLAQAQGDYAVADARYREALTIFTLHEDTHGTAEVALGLGAAALSQSELPVAREWLKRALDLFRQVSDPHGAAAALNHLAAVAFHRGEFDRAAPLWQECLRLLAQVGDERARSLGLSNLGVLELQRGRPERAVEHHQAALAIARSLNDKWAMTHALINLGRVLVVVGKPGEARPIFEEALANCRDLGDPIREALTLQNLALGALAERDFGRAKALVAGSVEISRRARDRIVIAGTLEVAATVVVAGGDAVAAARLLGAAEALRDEIGAVREGADQPDYDRTVRAIRSLIDTAEYEAALAAGRADSFEAAIATALSSLAAESVTI